MQQRQNDQAVATITRFLAEVDAAEDEEEQLDVLGDGVDVRVNGQVWCLYLEPDGWEAWPGHDHPEMGWRSVELEDTDGEPWRLGGADLTPEAIVEFLASSRGVGRRNRG